MKATQCLLFFSAAHPDEACVQQMGMVWDLCVALWGNMPEFKDIGKWIKNCFNLSCVYAGT